MSGHYISPRYRAYEQVDKAKRSGLLTPSLVCDLCDDETSHPRGHHWRGYNFPLDVWWVCRSCNGLIRIHDGSLTKEEARARVALFRASANRTTPPKEKKRPAELRTDRINVSTGAYDEIIGSILSALQANTGNDYFTIACESLAGLPAWDEMIVEKRRVLVRAAIRRLRK